MSCSGWNRLIFYAIRGQHIRHEQTPCAQTEEEKKVGLLTCGRYRGGPHRRRSPQDRRRLVRFKETKKSEVNVCTVGYISSTHASKKKVWQGHQAIRPSFLTVKAQREGCDWVESTQIGKASLSFSLVQELFAVSFNFLAMTRKEERVQTTRKRTKEGGIETYK